MKKKVRPLSKGKSARDRSRRRSTPRRKVRASAAQSSAIGENRNAAVPSNATTSPTTTTGIALKIFKFEAEGDAVYVSAGDETAARARHAEVFGPVPDDLMKISIVDALPEGEKLV